MRKIALCLGVYASVLAALGVGAFALDFSPAPLKEGNSTYGSVSLVGYYQREVGQRGGGSLATSDGSRYENERGAVGFGLKRGVMLGEEKAWLLGAWLDGYAGSENKNGLYGASVGLDGGYRILGGRLIALGGVGFMMSNLALSHGPKEQANIYGGVARAELFIDIAQGFGLSVGYMRGFSHKSKKLIGERFDTDSLFVAIRFYDFGI